MNKRPWGNTILWLSSVFIRCSMGTPVSYVVSYPNRPERYRCSSAFISEERYLLETKASRTALHSLLVPMIRSGYSGVMVLKVPINLRTRSSTMRNRSERSFQ